MLSSFFTTKRKVPQSPEDFFADCEDDEIKMIDKFLEKYPSCTWAQLSFLLRKLLVEHRNRLERERNE